MQKKIPPAPDFYNKYAITPQKKGCPTGDRTTYTVQKLYLFSLELSLKNNWIVV